MGGKHSNGIGQQHFRVEIGESYSEVFVLVLLCLFFFFFFSPKKMQRAKIKVVVFPCDVGL